MKKICGSWVGRRPSSPVPRGWTPTPGRWKYDSRGKRMAEPEGIEKYILYHLARFTGYNASTSPDTLAGKVDVPPDSIIKMNANENPYGCSPRVLRALGDTRTFHIYPDEGQQELRRL